MAEPFEAGAVQETEAWELPATATTLVGEPGAAAGVTPLEAADAGPVPMAFVADTVKA